MRLIDADKLLDDIDDVSCAMREFKTEYAELVDEQPTVDVHHVIHAKWIMHPHSKSPYECSNCNCEHGFFPFKYCYECGARMDGD